MKNFFFKKPLLLNINTNRMFWHSGAGQDSYDIFDRLKFEKKRLGKKAILLEKKNEKYIKNLWQKTLEKQSKK